MNIKSLKVYWLYRSLKYYISNHIIANCPFESVRHCFYKNVLNIKIGKQSHVSMGQFITGFHKKPNIVIGNNTVVNRNCYLDGRIGIEIQDNVNISFGVTILTLQHDPQSPNFACTGGKVLICQNAWIGINAIIMPGVVIGKGAVVGAGAVVTRNIPDYCIAVGIPAKVIKSRNKELSYVNNFHPYSDTDIFDKSESYKR